jgi:hypothetical protein
MAATACFDLGGAAWELTEIGMSHHSRHYDVSCMRGNGTWSRRAGVEAGRASAPPLYLLHEPGLRMGQVVYSGQIG